MRDHREAAQPKEVGAAVGLGVEAAAKAASGRPDEQSAHAAAAARDDFLAEGIEHGRDRPLRQLEHHVPGEAVADDDVRGAEQEVAALRVAAEVQPVCGGQQLVSLERELVPLLGLLADREQAHLGPGHVEHLLGEDGPHVGELEQVLGAGIRVRPGVDEHRRTMLRRDHDRDRRPRDTG